MLVADTMTYSSDLLLWALQVTNAFLPLLTLSRHGRIVNVSSTVGSFGDPDFGLCGQKGPQYMPYQSSKAALNAVTILFAKYLASTGSHVKVNAVSPGFCATDLNDHRGTKPASEGAQIAIKMALIGADGPTGHFYGNDGPLPW